RGGYAGLVRTNRRGVSQRRRPPTLLPLVCTDGAGGPIGRAGGRIAATRRLSSDPPRCWARRSATGAAPLFYPTPTVTGSGAERIGADPTGAPRRLLGPGSRLSAA